ncbi:MAG: hypothetical protein ACTTJE_07845 [Schwartzia sp. (in: firmicutes)]
MNSCADCAKTVALPFRGEGQRFCPCLAQCDGAGSIAEGRGVSDDF